MKSTRCKFLFSAEFGIVSSREGGTETRMNVFRWNCVCTMFLTHKAVCRVSEGTTSFDTDKTVLIIVKAVISFIVV
jgi:hypothetical protein